MQRFFAALQALGPEDRQAAVFSLVAGALQGADEEDTLCEAICSCVNAIGLVLFVVRPGSTRLLGVTDPTHSDPVVLQRVANVVDAAMKGMRASVAAAIEADEKAASNG